MTAQTIAGVSVDRDAVKGRSVLYVDMAYTVEIVRTKGHFNFFETRHSHGFFERVWGVHPLADIGGSPATRVETYRVTSKQTIIEGVSRSRRWPRFLAPLDLILSQAELALSLGRLIRREDIDVIVASDPVYSGLFARVLKALSGRPLAVGIYANYEFAYRTTGTLAMPRLFPWLWLQNLVARIVLRGADLVIGGTRNYLDWAVRHGAGNARQAVIPIARNIEPCHLSDPATRGAPAALLRELGIPVEGRHMVMISRLIPVKFAEDGVRAMIRAAERDPAAVGIVAGDGPLRPKLEQLVAEAGVSDRIAFIGHVSQEEISRIAPHCVTLSPLTGMALVEAALGGSPAVVYDADWQPEFVEDGINGFVVPLRDHQAMADRVLQLLRDDSLRTRMSRSMREQALRAADREAIAETERAVFTQLLEAKRRPRHRP